LLKKERKKKGCLKSAHVVGTCLPATPILFHLRLLLLPFSLSILISQICKNSKGSQTILLTLKATQYIHLRERERERERESIKTIEAKQSLEPAKSSTNPTLLAPSRISYQIQS